MKSIIAFFLILFGTEIKSQNIFKYNEWYSIVTLKEYEKILVTEKTYNVNHTDISCYGFKRLNGKIYCRYFEDELFKEDLIDKYEPCQLYPHLIKIRNNNFEIIKSANNTLVFDKKGRVIEMYYPTLVMYFKRITTFKFLYVNDTIIYEYVDDGQRNPKQLYKYELDLRKNLKSVKEASIDYGHVLKDSADIVQVAFSGVTKFLYNKLNRVDSIQTFAIDDEKEILQSTQHFIYKNGRPSKGYAVDEKTKKVVYRQSYVYQYANN